MAYRLMEETPVLGGLERIWADEDGNVIDEVQANVEPLLDLNQQARCHDMPKTGIHTWDGFRLVARIDLMTAYAWMRDEGIDVLNPDHWPRVEKKLNDRDFMKFRTVDGTV